MTSSGSKCLIDGCEKPSKNRGWCWGHYARWRRYGSPDISKRATPDMNPPELCTVDGCTKPHKSIGYCIAHYNRHYRYGDVEFTSQTPPGEPMAWIESHKNYSGDECLKWPYASGGRGDAVVSHKGRMRSASRVMLEISSGMAKEEDMECAHNCGKGHEGCMNPKHLRWDTRSGNLADKVMHGTHSRGSNSKTSKLTEDQALEILLSENSVKALSLKFGVSSSLISAIRLGKRWSHLSARGV